MPVLMQDQKAGVNAFSAEKPLEENKIVSASSMKEVGQIVGSVLAKPPDNKKVTEEWTTHRGLLIFVKYAEGAERSDKAVSGELEIYAGNDYRAYRDDNADYEHRPDNNGRICRKAEPGEKPDAKAYDTYGHENYDVGIKFVEPDCKISFTAKDDGLQIAGVDVGSALKEMVNQIEVEFLNAGKRLDSAYRNNIAVSIMDGESNAPTYSNVQAVGPLFHGNIPVGGQTVEAIESGSGQTVFKWMLGSRDFTYENWSIERKK